LLADILVEVKVERAKLILKNIQFTDVQLMMLCKSYSFMWALPLLPQVPKDVQILAAQRRPRIFSKIKDKHPDAIQIFNMVHKV